ncbi:SDR family NAD(P)-dependent oxidoreductase [Pisciglobus halotolerans]|uniref:NAD(P)-dependent dehydrogenase, short-chain alcohol dehydrogenase family n=1 Tax=Pisciglobus halotolerans TaxID=745365 RepID=A0A1I3DD77_9LACT|nr:SDR family oxidoreductase [Pisciglobus halotolerans]SFH84596.1 NAD(P)-dependent dehydrogenase, short-chain alcohol dehydrogenase family [Pisciglobus halotolerans]
MLLQGKAAIVTGGAGGIGAGLSKALAAEGANVAVVDVNEENGMALVKKLEEMGVQGIFLNKDISVEKSAKEIRDAVIEKFGRLDILINNAHVSRQASFMETTDELFELSFKTGFAATVFLMRACYEGLKATKGTVINFASGSAMKGMEKQASYAASKEAIRGLSRVVANEWAPDGIRVNLISPIAETEGVSHWKEQFPDEYRAMANNIPLKRLGDPQKDIGQVAVFLASDMSSFMTGQTLMVDGGSIQLY